MIWMTEQYSNPDKSLLDLISIVKFMKVGVTLIMG